MLTTSNCGFQPSAESDPRRGRVGSQGGHVNMAPENLVMSQASEACLSEDHR